MNDSIRHHVLQSGGSILDERWYGSAEEERDAFIAEAEDAAAEAARGRNRDRGRVREDVRLAVRRCATRWTGKKPVVDVLMIEV